jgi:hypothetical protein
MNSEFNMQPINKVVVHDEEFFWYAIPPNLLSVFKTDDNTLSTRDMYLKYIDYSLHNAQRYDEHEKCMLCSVTGESIDEGWQVNEFGFYFKYEHHASQWCLEWGYSSIEEAIKDGALSEVVED